MAATLERGNASERLEGFADRARLVCMSGDAVYSTKEPIYECVKPHEERTNLLDVTYDFPTDLDPERLKQIWIERRKSNHPLNNGIWRFRELFPFVDDPSDIVTLGEGNTRLLEGRETARYVGLPRLLLKHQGDNPTGSFKDPGMSAAITEAKRLNMKAVACASTGNTSASMAAYAQRADMLPIVILPQGQISYGKLSQSLDFGALTLQVDTNFDGVMKLIMEVAPELGIYVVNSINPFRLEGQKTIVAELLEQMDWQIPDRIVVPGGNMGHAASIWKGLRELKELGFIDRYPRLTIVQAKGANPLYRGVTSKHPERMAFVEDADTLATAIKIGRPVSYWKAMEGARATDGWIESVTETQIANAKMIIGRDGIGCEPASAVTIAGLEKMVRIGTDVPFNKDELVVVILTGNGLKDPDYTVLSHLKRLHVKFKTGEPIVDETSRRISVRFANEPITNLPPDSNRIIKEIRKRMAA